MNDKFNIEEFLNEIEEHFEEISVDQFEKNLKKAGVERIEEPSHDNKNHINIEKFHDEAIEELNNLSDEEFLEILHDVGVDCKLKENN